MQNRILLRSQVGGVWVHSPEMRQILNIVPSRRNPELQEYEAMPSSALDITTTAPLMGSSRAGHLTEVTGMHGDSTPLHSASSPHWRTRDPFSPNPLLQVYMANESTVTPSTSTVPLGGSGKLGQMTAIYLRIIKKILMIISSCSQHTLVN